MLMKLSSCHVIHSPISYLLYPNLSYIYPVFNLRKSVYICPHHHQAARRRWGSEHISKIKLSVVGDRANKSPIFVVKFLVYHHFIAVKIRISPISRLSR